jgi:hypothetical protein
VQAGRLEHNLVDDIGTKQAATQQQQSSSVFHSIRNDIHSQYFGKPFQDGT